MEQLFSTVTKTQLNFYKLSLQLPPTVCNSGPPEFTINRLWPQDSNDDAVILLIQPTHSYTNVLLPVSIRLVY